MWRFLGTNTPAKKPDLDTTISKLDAGIASSDVRIAQAEAALRPVLQKINDLKARGKPVPQNLKERAQDLLKRRKVVESQARTRYNMQGNLEGAKAQSENLEYVMAQVEAMKTTNKALKQQYGKVDIDKIERLQDEMADLMDVGKELEESLSRAYGLPEDVDESELDAELDALGEEMQYEQEAGIGETPGFLQDEVPTFVDAPPQQSKVQEPAGGVG